MGPGVRLRPNRAPDRGSLPGAPFAWTRGLGRVFAHGAWNSRVIGAENVPATGPVLFAANHASIMDGRTGDFGAVGSVSGQHTSRLRSLLAQ